MYHSIRKPLLSQQALLFCFLCFFLSTPYSKTHPTLTISRYPISKFPLRTKTYTFPLQAFSLYNTRLRPKMPTQQKKQRYPFGTPPLFTSPYPNAPSKDPSKTPAPGCPWAPTDDGQSYAPSQSPNAPHPQNPSANFPNPPRID